jgi:hypothetical protein
VTARDDGGLVAMAMPPHIAAPGMPCFACWLEAMLGAAGDVYEQHGHEAYEQAVLGAIDQVGQCLGGLLAALGSGEVQGQLLRGQFLDRLDGAMLLHDAGTEGVAH